ncbi:CGLD27 family protein [Myxacorys almedinensis]|uniref:CGLD27 family protein n=1 Tax=Myxacorys almedinensis A TaxID=2690445 RepID=A0A8J7Z652_9CYAN|nr:CGLD27 family protein [Myxacorys almedinensis]NDJ16185.1 CGLD27 family protein [Myxacorys almedinensis A]
MNSVTCPVPVEQRPLNEYQDLKTSWFFRWATLDRWGYLKPIAILWVINWLVAGPIASVSFAPSKHLPQFLLLASIGASLIPILALVRLYLGWVYVRTRLLNTSVFYEESGWYDGQIWQKPPEVLAQDQLIVSYQIQPILQRLQKSFAAIAAAFLLCGVVWWLL